MRNLARYTFVYTALVLGIGVGGVLHKTFSADSTHAQNDAGLAVALMVSNRLEVTNTSRAVESGDDIQTPETHDVTPHTPSQNETCPFAYLQDGYIIDFTKHEMEFVQDSVTQRIDSLNPEHTHIPAGVYRVESASYSPIDTYGVGINSRSDGWYAELLASDGKPITDTNATRDSVANEFAKEILDEELAVSNNVYAITLHRNRYSAENSYNSIPLCLVFTKTEEIPNIEVSSTHPTIVP